MPNALRFEPRFEIVEEDEAQAAADIATTMRGISETTFENYGRAVRSVHAKANALLSGEMQVLADLPEELAQGIYRPSARYRAALRLSTIPGDILDDSINIGVPRGMAVKVMGVPGERLPGSEGDTTLDYVMVNGPAFQTAGAKAFGKNLKLLAATTETTQGWKKAAVAVTRGVEAVVEAFGGESVMLKQMGGHPRTHPLGETFYSQVPMLHGPYMAKISVAPVSAGLVALTDAAFDVDGRPDAIREAMLAFFATQGGEWEVRAQLCTDLETMPIEDASVAWPEDVSPYRAIARIVVAPQPSWSEARARAMDDGLAFSPWHGVAAHRPIGSVMRARQSAYEMSAQFRGTRNGCPMHEPRDAAEFPA